MCAVGLSLVLEECGFKRLVWIGEELDQTVTWEMGDLKRKK